MGGEDVGSYARNFIDALRSKGWLVAGVNAHDAKNQRENMQASTDRLDLIGIAKLLLNCRGNCNPAQSGIFLNLQSLVRHRAKNVIMSTEVKNRIHTLVDRLFPGFLNEKKSGVLPFTKSSLALMEDRFSAKQIRGRKRQTLINLLGRMGLNKSENAADKLQKYAAQCLNPPDEYISTLQISLAQHVKHYRCLNESICQLEKEIAIWLAQTNGAFLTSIKGIGLVLASGVASEIGDPYSQKPLNNLASYAGIIPKVKQTGGPSGETYTGSVARRCNRILKNYVVQSASHIGLHGPDELMLDYGRRESEGQHADFGMARRYLRIAMCLMKKCHIYVPSQVRNADDPKVRAAYYLMVWPGLREKWKKLDALKIAFARDNPLGLWRAIIQDFYRIKLTL